MNAKLNVVLFGALVAGASFAANVLAAEPVRGTVKHIVVTADDLDLDTAAGIQTLHERIVTASRRACEHRGRTEVRLARYERECRAQAIAAAVRAYDRPELAAVHARTKRGG